MSWVLFIALMAGWYIAARRLRELEGRISEVERFISTGVVPASAPEVYRPPEPASRPQSEAPPAPPAPVPAEAAEGLEPGPATGYAARGLFETPERTEWESVLGANLLHKAGIGILLIGIALFLRYSFQYLDPAGRVIVAAAAGVALLGLGLYLEPRERYRAFARGLIGGGWAALYGTAYAAHAVDAARIIENPAIATLVLMAVSCGSILHSLRYRSELVAAMGFFLAYLTLAVSPISQFAMVAVLPLSAALLAVVWSFRWSTVALPAMVGSYIIYFVHASALPDVNVWGGQALLFGYWAVYEAFCVVNAQWIRRGVGTALFAGNTGFLILYTALLFYSGQAADDVYQALGLAAVVLLVDVWIRVWQGLEPYGAVIASALLIAWTIFEGLSGFAINVALLAEAELLFLISRRLRQPLLCHLSTAVFFGAFCKLLSDTADRQSVEWGPFVWHDWCGFALAQSALLYVNRALDRANELQSYFAGLLFAFVTFGLVEGRVFTLAWGVQGIALVAAGLWSGVRSLRLAGLMMLVLCIGKLFAYDLSELEMPLRIASFVVLGILLIGVSWGYARLRRGVNS